jgi:tetratricopeptide (TPR) repeat protein
MARLAHVKLQEIHAMPLLSVVIAAYNSARYIGETSASISGQEKRDLGVTMIDDGSTNETVAVAQSFEDSVKVIEQTNADLSKQAVGAVANFRHRMIAVSVVGLIFGAMNFAHAGKPENINQGEMALIPPYCADTQGFKYGNASYNPSPRAGYWVGLMGPSFWDMHHYCWALLALRRAAGATSAQQRRGLWESAVGDIQYVVKNSSPNFVLLPEILVTLGGVYVLLSNVSAAYDAFLRARELKADYWPAYSDWAEVLIKSGQKSQAKALVKTGLEQSPDSKVLQDQYRRLGGALTEIVPITKRAVPAEVIADPVAQPESNSAAPKPAESDPKKP